MQISHCPHIEMPPDELDMGIILLTNARVGVLRAEVIFRLEVCLLNAGKRVYILLRVQPLPYDDTQPFIVFVGEPLLEIQELVDSPFRHVCCNGLEAGPEELQRVHENEVFAMGEAEVVLHPLPN